MALPRRQSAFLWGARKTGKSTYLKERFSQSLVFDFLDTDLVLEFSKRPALLRDQLLAQDANVLKGGRAWRFEMFPLVRAELKNIDLLRVLNHGIPNHYLEDQYQKSLKAYTTDYLTEDFLPKD